MTKIVLGFTVLCLPPMDLHPFPRSPNKKVTFRNHFFDQNRSDSLGVAVLRLPPPGFKITSRGFCVETPKPSTAPQALLRPTSPTRCAIGLHGVRAGLRRFGAGLRVRGTGLRQRGAISVKRAGRMWFGLRPKMSISVGWSRLRGSRPGPRSVCARLRSFFAGFRGSGAGPRDWRCFPETKNRFLKAFQKPFKKYS